jgi:hypothetical protein
MTDSSWLEALDRNPFANSAAPLSGNADMDQLTFNISTARAIDGMRLHLDDATKTEQEDLA